MPAAPLTIIFDLDGTLVDTPQAIVDVAQGTLAALRSGGSVPSQPPP